MRFMVHWLLKRCESEEGIPAGAMPLTVEPFKGVRPLPARMLFSYFPPLTAFDVE